jgi:hypothetical protein
MFQGKEYPITIVNMPFGERVISTENLNGALMNNDGSYISNEARMIDEKIFYFVEEEVFHFSENEIVNKILSEI